MRGSWMRWHRGAAAMAVIAGLAVLAAGCAGLFPAQRPAPGAPEVVPAPAGDTVEVTLYFADFQAQYVMPETRNAARVGNAPVAELVVRELLAGPRDPHLHRTLPEGTRLLSLDVADGVAYVNFSRDVQQLGGSAAEGMAIQSLVFSLTDLEGVDRVQILIEGRTSESLGGHFILSEPIGRGPIKTVPVFVDTDRVAWLQDEADAGRQAFRTDPLAVARFDGRMAGFTADDRFEVFVRSDQQGAAYVLARHGDEEYLIRLMQIGKKGPDGIWSIVAIVER